jgi:hypothetical protein
MPKRAERRHHAARLVRKYREVAKRWAGSVNRWIHKWQWEWDENKKQMVNKRHIIDRTGERERLEFIEETSKKLVNHHNCDCGMCHGERYDRRKDLPPIDDE